MRGGCQGLQNWSTPSEYSDVDTAAAIVPRMSDLVQDFGLEYFSFLFISGPGERADVVETTFHTNYPAEWVNRYAKQKYWEIDPVADLGGRAIRPFFWGSKSFLRDFSKSQRVVFEEAGVFNINYGLTIPIRGPRGEISVFSIVSGSKSHLEDALHEKEQRIYSAAFDTHEIALKQIETSEKADEAVSLSPREKECLSWTLEGKTAWEIATILGISVSTVNQHAASASKKMGSLNKHHAAVQALRRNLIR